MKRIFQARGSVPVPGIAPGQVLRRRLLGHFVEVLKADRAKNVRVSDSGVEFTSGVGSISGPFPKSPLGCADEGSIRVEETFGMMCVSYHLVYWRSLKPLVLFAFFGFLVVQLFPVRVDRFIQVAVSEWRWKTFTDPTERVSTPND